jgi:hypothetical protein
MEWLGYKPLRPGRIHLWCPECKRKMSNVERSEYDPPRAVMCHVLCDRCADRLGAKDASMDYLDAGGKRVEWWNDRARPASVPESPRA